MDTPSSLPLSPFRLYLTCRIANPQQMHASRDFIFSFLMTKYGLSSHSPEVFHGRLIVSPLSTQHSLEYEYDSRTQTGAPSLDAHVRCLTLLGVLEQEVAQCVDGVFAAQAIPSPQLFPHLDAASEHWAKDVIARMASIGLIGSPTLLPDELFRMTKHFARRYSELPYALRTVTPIPVYATDGSSLSSRLATSKTSSQGKTSTSTTKNAFDAYARQSQHQHSASEADSYVLTVRNPERALDPVPLQKASSLPSKSTGKSVSSRRKPPPALPPSAAHIPRATSSYIPSPPSSPHRPTGSRPSKHHSHAVSTSVPLTGASAIDAQHRLMKHTLTGTKASVATDKHVAFS